MSSPSATFRHRNAGPGAKDRGIEFGEVLVLKVLYTTM
jgi:hypothetical protein